MWSEVLITLVISHLILAWDLDAGLVGSYTKHSGVKVISSSNPHEANLVIDGKDSTHWTSDGCLPMQYVAQKESNVLYHACQKGLCSGSTSSSLSSATDGSWGTSFTANVVNNKAELHVKLDHDTPLSFVTLQGHFRGPATITVDHGNSHKTVKVMNTQDNYHKESLALHNATASSISITSHKSFEIEEIAALGPRGCVDRLVVDLGSVKTIGSIRVRSWPGEETFYSMLASSLDMQSWHKIADLNSKITEAQTFKVDPPVHARYISVEHHIHTKDWVKSFVWEVDAFGAGGNWGSISANKPNPNSLHAMFGVNGIWGWGSRGPSKNLRPGQGPFLYDQVASHGRNYHQLGWDIQKPGNRAGYEQMARGHGTNGETWLNWDTEYNLWVQANLSVDASIQFKADKYPPRLWPNPKQNAYQFGKDFAAHFGPTRGNGLVTAAEVGNEPWDYLHAFYETILEGMAKGLKDGDPGIKVLPAAFQAHDKNAENPPWHANYIGTRVTPASAQYLDAINGHYYSFVKRADGKRIMSYPEDPLSEFNAMKNLIRWRDVNMPGKAVWITEYGWDSAGAGQTCTYSECVSESAASLYAIRALLIMARLGIERATWFYYANLDHAECSPTAQHIFCRSGLTGSKEVNFAKKKVFNIHKYFLDFVGDKHFLRAVKEDKEAYIYLLGDLQHGAVVTHVVAWRPVSAEDPASRTVSLDLRAHPRSAKYITPEGLRSTSLPISSGGRWSLAVKSQPVIVEVNRFSLTGSPIIG